MCLFDIYNVNEFSETLEDAYQTKFKYRVSELQPRYFDILLTAHVYNPNLSFINRQTKRNV